MADLRPAAAAIRTVNLLGQDDFRRVFGDVLESSPHLADAAWAYRPFADRHALVAAFVAVADGLDLEEVLTLLRAHPPLGLSGHMGSTSREEQTAAGLQALEADIRSEIAEANARYLDRFGFPFIIAVRGLSVADIVEAMKGRMDNTPTAEVATALDQVRRIAAFRVEQIVWELSRDRARIDGARLVDRLHQLRRIGAQPGGGVTREAYGPHDVAARGLVAGWMRDAGLDVTVDAAANLIGRRAGANDRWLVGGSHLDTVVDGGWLDGAYGVVAAVEVAAALEAASIGLDHGLVVVAFANEEGARGTAGMAGSRALVSALSAEELATCDDEGVSLRDRLAQAGGDADTLASAVWDPASVDAIVELHIEQGPILDVEGAVLGVVSAVTGRQALEVEITGVANHAGTTPMDLRHDALAAAAELILALEAMPARGVVRVATCGRIEVGPNVRNVVPGHVRLSAEFRDTDTGRLDAACLDVESQLDALSARRGVDMIPTWGQRLQPTPADPLVIDVLARVAAASGHGWRLMPSGAGHDAQVLGQVMPMGMLFIPSAGGLSHAPDEDSKVEHLVGGAQALLESMLLLDEEAGR